MMGLEIERRKNNSQPPPPKKIPQFSKIPNLLGNELFNRIK